MRLALFNIADFINKSRFSSLGLAYIASYLRKYSGFSEIHIIEGNAISKLRQINPDVIGIYSVTQYFNEAKLAADLIKNEFKNAKIIIGGYHISALPHTLPKSFDAAVLGEGEETMKELLESIATYGFDPDKLSDIKGIAFHADGRIKITPPRGFIKDIDSIPFPARDLICNNIFSNIITSRGCPYKCVFCSSVEFWGKPRFHSTEYVVEEIEEMINKYKAVHISIWDDLFIADRRRFEDICRLIQRKKINKKISFGCALRSNLIDHDVCILLKQINVKRVSFGFETGSQKILDFLKCGSVTIEHHIKAVKLCKSYGFFTTGTFMLGNPDETEEDLMETLTLIKNLKLDGGGTFTIAVPLPGTKLWEYARQRNLVDDKTDPAKLSLMTTDFTDPKSFKGILLTDKVPKERFFQIAQKIQKESNKYYLRGLFSKNNLSLTNIRFIIARPKEVLAILKFVIKSFFCKSSIMDRYVFYYKKSGN